MAVVRLFCIGVKIILREEEWLREFERGSVGETGEINENLEKAA
jgi:hypothetical protein